MTVSVPQGAAEVGSLVGVVFGAGVVCRPEMTRRAVAIVNQPPSLIGRPARVAQGPAVGVLPRAGASSRMRLATFPPFYRTFVFVAPPDPGKITVGYAGGDYLNRLKFIGKSGL